MSDKVVVGDLNSDAPGSAARRNEGKPDFMLLPLWTLAGAARVQMGGTYKYKDWNFAKGAKWSVPAACALRHIFKWFFLRQNIDKESGEHHLSCALLNIMYAIHYVFTFPDGDDRPPQSAMTEQYVEEFEKLFDAEAFCGRAGIEYPRPAELASLGTGVIDVGVF